MFRNMDQEFYIFNEMFKLQIVVETEETAHNKDSSHNYLMILELKTIQKDVHCTSSIVIISTLEISHDWLKVLGIEGDKI